MRSAGILLPVSSLPSPYGIGTMGAAARSFADFLSRGGQSFWQVLPVGPTSYGDSPYQSFSSFAGNPYLIDLDELADDGLLDRAKLANVEWGSDPACVDYGALYWKRFTVLREAVERLWERDAEDVRAFCAREASWLDDYALFMTLKDRFEGKPWSAWPKALRLRDPEALKAACIQYADVIRFWKGVQYLFFKQWEALRAYAAQRGIAIVGDLPIYAAQDSADVWAHPEQFQLDKDGAPIEVAGCPPDGFSATGQLWGNPLFDWERMEAEGFSWWIDRVAAQFRLYDVLRIDHFRGFESYYAIPAGSKDASTGHWRPGPGMRFFHALERALGRLRLIAEDLGFLTPAVMQMLADSGYPGMKVLEFGFDRRDSGGRVYQPHNYPRNSVAYVGTHDNEPALGWLEDADPQDAAYARAYLHLDKREGEGWGMMRGIWASPADLAVVQMQDLLGLGHEARMNTPSTLGGNWCWRALPGFDSPELADRLREQMFLYDRLPQAAADEAAQPDEGESDES